MLIRFAISNYLSFNQEVEFNMLTGSPRRFKEHIYRFEGLELLKTATVYGPNGAGKSNLIKGIELLKKIVTSGEWDPIEDIIPFRLQASPYSKPTTFEIEFVKNQQSYNYGISIFNGIVTEEWLYSTRFGKKDELIFNRTTEWKGNTTIKINDRYYINEQDKFRIELYEKEILKENQPLIYVLSEAKQKFSEVTEVHNWFNNDLVIIFPESRPVGLIIGFTLSEKFQNFVHDLLCSLQTGVSELAIETMDIDQYFGEDDREQADRIKAILAKNENKGFFTISTKSNHVIATGQDDKVVVKRLITRHKGSSDQHYDFSLEEESDGTRRILDFLPALFKSIFSESTVIIDEVDRSIHPHLLKTLIDKFVKDEKTKGQFIFTTHESNLLDQAIFRQDEIWFSQKDADGATKIYPLSEFDIRFDLNIQKGYLQGRFGAIPFMGNLKDLNWDIYAEAEQSI